jgi:hypothetical protein
MLRHPDKYLPVTTAAGFPAEVSTDWSGDFRIKRGAELYLNPFHLGPRFFRVAVMDVIHGPTEVEEVTGRDLLKSLLEAKDSYIRLYFE